jgi:hypothetical protein
MTARSWRLTLTLFLAALATAAGRNFQSTRTPTSSRVTALRNIGGCGPHRRGRVLADERPFSGKHADVLVVDAAQLSAAGEHRKVRSVQPSAESSQPAGGKTRCDKRQLTNRRGLRVATTRWRQVFPARSNTDASNGPTRPGC